MIHRNRFLQYVLFLALSSLAVGALAQAPYSAPPVGEYPAQLVVKFTADQHFDTKMRGGRLSTGVVELDQLNVKYETQGIERLLKDAGTPAHDNPLKDVFTLRVPPGTDLEAMAREFEQLEIVEYAHPDYPFELHEMPDDPQVYVLDPCCGTGAYLVEVLRKIHETLAEKSDSALTAQHLKTAAMKRVFGFEILPAPFVVSHLQLGLMLRTLGAPLSDDKNERVGVYLTNALTGWEPPKTPKDQIVFPELQEELEKSGEIKRQTPIIVILGNPPYNAFAGTSPKEEQGLVECYKEGLTKPVDQGGWGIKKFNLDDLYIRFFRIAERRIVESGKGVVCYISNFSYLGDPSFVVMRQQFLKEFDKLWFDCMNGDSRETGKLTPEGNPDPSVFSTSQSRVGIRVGTAISLMVRKERRSKKPAVRFRHLWGVDKREELLDSTRLKRIDKAYNVSKPEQRNRVLFRPTKVSADYVSWPTVTDFPATSPFNGPIERRGNSLIVFSDHVPELDSLRSYLDPSVADREVELLAPRFMRSSGEFKALRVREALKGTVPFEPSHIARYPFKPFDVRMAYLDPRIAPLFSRPSPELLEHARIPGNSFFLTRDTADKTREGPPFLFSPLVCDYDCVSGHARHFPVRIAPSNRRTATRDHNHVLDLRCEQEGKSATANLSKASRAYLKTLGLKNPDKDVRTAEMIWMHALAIGYSPSYLTENADGIRQDWPRIPLPKAAKALKLSADLGRKVAALLDTENSVSQVTSGRIRSELRSIGVVSRVGSGGLDPGAGELELTAGWGHGGKGGITMPGKGRVEPRAYTDKEAAAIEKGAQALGLSGKQALACLGKNTCDIYLNDVAYWRNVPANVWGYYIGGYQVIKKWLSYREKALLGRSVTMDEVEYVTEMIRRIAAITLLQPALNANYKAVKSNIYPWKAR